MTFREKFAKEFGHDPVPFLSPEDNLFVFGHIFAMRKEKVAGPVAREVVFNPELIKVWETQVPSDNVENFPVSETEDIPITCSICKYCSTDIQGVGNTMGGPNDVKVFGKCTKDNKLLYNKIYKTRSNTCPLDKEEKAND